MLVPRVGGCLLLGLMLLSLLVPQELVLEKDADATAHVSNAFLSGCEADAGLASTPCPSLTVLVASHPGRCCKVRLDDWDETCIAAPVAVPVPAVHSPLRARETNATAAPHACPLPSLQGHGEQALASLRSTVLTT